MGGGGEVRTGCRMTIPLTADLARAAAHDAGTRSMRRAGRTAWNEDDWNVAAAEYMRLLPLGLYPRPS